MLCEMNNKTFNVQSQIKTFNFAKLCNTVNQMALTWPLAGTVPLQHPTVNVTPEVSYMLGYL